MALESSQLDSIDSTTSLKFKMAMNRAQFVFSLLTPSNIHLVPI